MRPTILFSAGLASLLLFVAARQGQNFDKVEVKVTRAGGNVSMLEGSGGNIGVSVGDDGVLMIDSQFAPLEPKIREAIGKLSKGPIRLLVNTHFHGDHTGGNAKFGAEAVIVAQANVRKRLTAGDRPPAREALPIVTFDDHLSIHFNGEEVKIFHVPNGHTDTDAILFFTRSNVVHMGDDFFNARLPYIDRKSGGSVKGIIAAAERVISEVGPEVKIIPGHGTLATLDDLKAYVAMLKEASTVVADAVKGGMSLDALKKMEVWGKYEKFAWNFISKDVFVEGLYTEFK